MRRPAKECGVPNRSRCRASPEATPGRATPRSQAAARQRSPAELTKKARAGEQVEVQPSLLGGKNWQPMSFDPVRNVAFANTLNFGFNYKAIPQEWKVGEWYLGIDLTLGFAYAPNTPRGYLKAI